MSFSPQLFSLHEMYDTPDYVTTDTSTKSRTNSGNPAPNDSILITVHPSQTLPSQPHLMEETAGEAVAMATSSTPKSRAKSKKRKPGENRTSNQAGKLSSRLRPIAAAGGPFMTASTPTTSRTRPKDPQKSAASHSSPITTLSPQISAMDEINASPNNPSVTTPTKLPGTSEHRQTPTKPNSTRSRALSTPLETVDEIHHTAILPSMDTPRKPPTKPKHPRGAWVNNLWADVSGQMRRLAVITPDLFDGLLLSRSSATGSSLLQEMQNKYTLFNEIDRDFVTVLVVSPHGALNQPWRIIWGLKRPGALRETHSVMPVEDDDGSSSALEALNCTGTAHSVTAFSLPRFVQDFGVGPKQFDPTTPEGEHQERYVDLGMGIEMGDGGQQEVHWGVGQEIEQRVEYEVDQDMEIDEQDECHEKRE